MADLPILLTVIGALALLAVLAGRARREQAALRAQVEGLRERLDQVHLRL